MRYFSGTRKNEISRLTANENDKYDNAIAFEMVWLNVFVVVVIFFLLFGSTTEWMNGGWMVNRT